MPHADDPSDLAIRVSEALGVTDAARWASLTAVAASVSSASAVVAAPASLTPVATSVSGAWAVVATTPSAYMGVAKVVYLTSVAEWHPHDQARGEPLATVEVGTMGPLGLVFLMYASLGYVRHWRPSPIRSSQDPEPEL